MEYSDVFHGAKDLTGQKMREAIRQWYGLYYDSDPEPGELNNQRIANLVVDKLCKTVFSEYEADADGTGTKADFIRGLLHRFDAIKTAALQQSLIGGSSFIKPVLSSSGMLYRVIRRDAYVPLGMGDSGRLTSIGTCEVTADGNSWYTMYERRSVSDDGTLTIESKLYRSYDRQSTGSQVPLATLPQYAGLEPAMQLPGVWNLGMVELRCPAENCVDGSRQGASVYAPAVGLIHAINRNEQEIMDEFANGASRIIASSDLVRTGRDGRKRLDSKLFVGLDDDPEAVGVHIFSPTLRDQSYLARKNEYLRNIESLLGIKRGLISDVEAQQRTATEITSSDGDYNLTILSFQREVERALRELLQTSEVLGRLYHLCDDSDYDWNCVTVSWGDGVLYNRDKVWAEYSAMVAAGMLKPEIAVAWYFDLPHSTEADLAAVRRDYMPELEAMAGDA